MRVGLINHLLIATGAEYKAKPFLPTSAAFYFVLSVLESVSGLPLTKQDMVIKTVIYQESLKWQWLLHYC